MCSRIELLSKRTRVIRATSSQPHLTNWLYQMNVEQKQKSIKYELQARTSMGTFRTKTAFMAIVILLLRCTSPSDKQKRERSNNGWAKDKGGCMNIRNKDLADSLITANKLMGSSKETFLKVFQFPDSTSKTKTAVILIYYFDSICENGKPASGADKCYANFYFKANTLTKTNFVCE